MGPSVMHLAVLLVGLLLRAPGVPCSPGAADSGLATFDRVWTIIDEQHFDPQFNGVDWGAVKTRLRPRAEAARDQAELREVIEEMLRELEQSHFALIKSEDLAGGSGATRSSPAGTVGFDVRVRDGLALVSRVEPGGPAAAAGVRPGWILTAIEGEPVAELLAKLPRRPSLRPATVGRKGLLALIDGAVGSRASFEFEQGVNGFARTIELTRREREAVPYDLAGLPTFYLTLRAERLRHADLTIGVLQFSNWFHPLAREIDEALISMRDCDGIVLDLRANSGGAGALARKVAGHFFERPGSLGTQVARRGTTEYTFRPLRSHRGKRIEAFGGPLAILADETTGSCSEVFSGGMQALGRAHVIGERTAGAGLPAKLTQLPNQDYLLHAIGEFLTADGASLEGAGVLPDLVVPVVRAELLAGRDAPLEAAAEWIASELDR